MIFAAFRVVEHDALKNRGDGCGFDIQPGFLPGFPYDGVFEALAGFDQAAGQRPFAREGRATAFYEENAVAVVENESSDTEQRPSRVPPGHPIYIYWGPSSAWPSTFSFGKIFLIIPLGSMIKVARSTPMYLRPYMLFSPQTP